MSIRKGRGLRRSAAARVGAGDVRRRAAGDAGVGGRCVWWQRRPVDSGADGAAFAGDGQSGQADHRSRRVDSAASQAPPADHALSCWLRCRRTDHVCQSSTDWDKGAYASVGSKVIERACGHATGAYDVEHVDVEGLAVYTTIHRAGAMRGFGANQANFAMESALDMLAEKLGLDAWDICSRNALSTDRRFVRGRNCKAVGLRKTLDAVRPHYPRLRGRRANRSVWRAGSKTSASATALPTSDGRRSWSTTTARSRWPTATPKWGRVFYDPDPSCEHRDGASPSTFVATVDTADKVPSGDDDGFAGDGPVQAGGARCRAEAQSGAIGKIPGRFGGSALRRGVHFRQDLAARGRCQRSDHPPDVWLCNPAVHCR